MEGKYGCDMRGMLSFQILYLLSKKPMHGEELAKELEKRRGEKPKAGPIYPALKDLNERGLISGEKDGKIIVYSLTTEGKKVIIQAKAYFCKCFGEIIREVE